MQQKTIFITKFWVLVRPYWQSNAKYQGFLWLGLLLGFVSFEIYMMVQMNLWNRDFFDAIGQYNYTAFKHAFIYGTIIMFGFVMATTASTYCSSILEIKWRSWLTDYYLQSWLDSDAYYRHTFTDFCDNPDQRISDDIRQFINLSLKMLVDGFRSINTFISFIVILWGFSKYYLFQLSGHSFYIPGYMVWIALLYAVVGVYFTFKIGNPLIRIDYDQEHYEANFRYDLVNIRNNSDKIFGHKGSHAEKKIANDDFRYVVNNFILSIKQNLKINVFNYSYGQLSTMIPILFSAGRYFAHKITLGDMMQINSAFARLQYAISYFMYAYKDIASWRAVINRLTDLHHMINSDNLTNIKKYEKNLESYLEISRINISLPNGKSIITDFKAVFTRGEKVLILGASGSGKTTLLKTLNSMWPFADGNIIERANLKTLYISQYSYMPQATLKEVLCYPMLDDLPSDKDVIGLMNYFGLGKHVDLILQKRDWMKTFSGGELQKIAFCRVAINNPDIIYLDEVTSSLDEDSCLKLYQQLFDLMPNSCIISVAHHKNLIKLHHKIIYL